MRQDNILNLSFNKTLGQEIQKVSCGERLSWLLNQISNSREEAFSSFNTLSNQDSNKKWYCKEET